MAHSGNYLAIHTCHEMYTSSDGYNHQANVTILVNMSDMTIIKSRTAVSNSKTGYVSHSFNQFIKIDNNKLVTIDHGDAYPRSIALITNPTAVSDSSFAFSNCTATNVLELQGEVGANTTRASVGGFEVTDSTYLVAGNSIVQDENYASRSTRNIFVASVNKSTKAVTMNWLTEDEEGATSNSTPHLVKISDSKYMVLWAKSGNVYYTMVDATGKKTGEIYQMTGVLSDCVPIVNDGKVIWYTWSNQDFTVYTIDTTDLSKFETKTLSSGHNYELTETDGTTATLTCTKCQESKTGSVPTSFYLYWQSGSYYSTGVKRVDPDTDTRFLISLTNSNSDDDFNEVVLTIEGEEDDMATITRSSNTYGSARWNKEGPVTVTAYLKYNPDVKITYTMWIGKMPISEVTSYLKYPYTYTYDGTAKEATVYVSGLTQDTDYTVTYEDNINAGTAKAIIAGIGDYNGTKELTYTIEPASILDESITMEEGTYTYNGQEHKPKVTVEGLEEGKDYTLTYSNNIKAGTGRVTVAGTGNYTSSKTMTFTINKADISEKEMTTEQASYVYNGTYQKPEIIIEGLTSGTDYSVTYENNKNVGTATATVTGKGNYQGTKTVNFTIEQASIKDVTVTLGATSYTYSGTARTPSVSVSGLTKNTDYTVTYKNNINVGTASVVLEGIGNYKDTKEVTFTIEPAAITYKAFTLESSSYTYDGTAHEPAVTSGSGLTFGTDYTVTYKDNINAGTATAIVAGTGNYTGTKEYTFTIKKASLSNLTATLAQKSFNYDGTAHEPAVTIDGLTAGTDYTVTYTNNTEVGTAYAAITGIGNYTGSQKLAYTISKTDVSGLKATLDQSQFQYDGSAHEPKVTLGALTEGKDFTVKYKNNVHAGTATAVITGIDNCYGETSVDFVIQQQDLSDKKAVLSQDSYEYTGAAIKPAVTIDGLTAGTDYTVTYKNNTNVGTATATVTGTGNYKGNISLTFAITKANIANKDMKLSATSFVYSGEAHEPTVVCDGLKLGTDYTVAYSNNKNIGTATVTVSGTGNYTGSKTLTFEITRIPMSGVTATLEQEVYDYDGTSHEPAVTVKGLTEGVDYEVEYRDTVNVGTASVVLTGKGFYEGSKTLTYTIRGIDISDKAATLEQTTYVFDGTAHKPAVTVEGLTEGTDYTVSYKNNTSYGTATVIITGAGNYEGTIQLTFTISAPAGIAEEDIEDLQSDLGLSAAGAVTILDFANKNDIAKETMLITDKSITTQKSEEVKAATFIVLSAKASKTTSKQITLKWNSVKGADGYIIYGNKCGKSNKYKQLKTVKKTTWTQKKLLKGKSYKYLVVAYKVVDGKKVTIAAAKTVHQYTTGGTYGNAKSVKVNKKKVTLKTGKTFTIKASEVKKDKKLKKHRKIAYESSNKKVATVTSKGKVKAVGKGTCYIYAYAQNGVYTKVKVTVK